MSDNNGGSNPMKSALSWVVGLGSIALLLLIFGILFGNLSGNIGFAVNSAGYNNTQSVINNATTSFSNTAGQFPVIGTIIGVAILLLILISVAIWAIRKFNAMGQNSGGPSFG